MQGDDRSLYKDEVNKYYSEFDKLIFNKDKQELVYLHTGEQVNKVWRSSAE